MKNTYPEVTEKQEAALQEIARIHREWSLLHISNKIWLKGAAQTPAERTVYCMRSTHGPEWLRETRTKRLEVK